MVTNIYCISRALGLFFCRELSVLPAKFLGVSDREDRAPFVLGIGLQLLEVIVGVFREKDFDLNQFGLKNYVLM